MSRRAVHALALGGLTVVGLGVALLVSPVAPARAMGIALFVVAALVLAAIVLDVASALPLAEPSALERSSRPQRVGQLESLARALDLAEASAFHLHNTLRPIVREIAAARLARHGVSLYRQPERARTLVGERTWELVRPDREAPAGRSGRGGCGRDELRAIVASLEAI